MRWGVREENSEGSWEGFDRCRIGVDCIELGIICACCGEMF